MDTVKTPPAAASRYPTMPGTVPPEGPGGVGRPARPLHPRKIGEVLLVHDVITEQQLEECLERQFTNPPGTPRRRLGALVIEAGFATDRQIAQALAEAQGLELVDLGRIATRPDVVRLLPRPVAERLGVLVLERTGRRVRIATADPTNVVALDDVRLYTGATDLTVVVAPESQIHQTLSRAWSLSEDSTDVTTLFQSIDDERPEMPTEAALTKDAPIVKLVDTIFADAMRAGASDVHVEPQAGALRIRYRVDGLLRDVMEIPRSAAASITSRIKIISGLDISERRRPQDGRTRLTAAGRTSDARVSTLPGVHGEKVVVRLLPTSDNMPALASVGLDAAQLEALRTTLDTPQGLVLITGPTGSGKTNTLYAAIKEINAPERNIITLEDPVEVQLGGITQVQINDKAGLTFGAGLRSVLRQDPDVVLVGEVRDAETAELALQASLTGHLVLTTLHTNDAVSAVTRLVDMGVEPFLVASSLALVVAQRLVRRPCPACAVPAEPPSRVMSLLGLTPADLVGTTPRMGPGCAECAETGYRGRVGVFEVLTVTAALRAVLLTTPTEAAISAAARATGWTTLRASALAAASRGDTTFDEVLRVTHIDATAATHCTTCQRTLAPDMVACPWCATVVTSGHCARCRRPIDVDWKICPWCQQPAPPRAERNPDSGPVRPRLLLVGADDALGAVLAEAMDGVVELHREPGAESALHAVAVEHFAGALVCDTLPDLAGAELIRVLRTDVRTNRYALLLLSAGSPECAQAAATVAGADGWLVTPYDPETVAAAVQQSLARHVA